MPANANEQEDRTKRLCVCACAVYIECVNVCEFNRRFWFEASEPSASVWLKPVWSDTFNVFGILLTRNERYTAGIYSTHTTFKNRKKRKEEASFSQRFSPFAYFVHSWTFKTEFIRKYSIYIRFVCSRCYCFISLDSVFSYFFVVFLVLVCSIVKQIIFTSNLIKWS